MSTTSNPLTEEIPGHIPRATLCLSDVSRDTVLHAGDAGFSEALQQYFISPESNASEQLISLKAKLRVASTHDFWTIALENLCKITGSQCSFVSKRILVDDHNTAVEMPPLGEPGSCLMGVGLYFTPDSVSGTMYHDYKYHAYGTPCAHMKHDKVFIVPERMTEFIRNNPNKLPFKCEAYIGVPLFFKGKCFAHFGMIWSDEGAKKRNLSWGFIEMLLHALEDMILERILLGKGFAKEPVSEDQAKMIPLDAITASQSLKPYARSLSHELRTPMQGVVGMLDIMYSTVVGSIETQRHEHVRAIFQDLKENIEQAQDSSKRAVEAADAVVHAYDLNMQMPDTPLASPDGSNATDLSREESHKLRPGIVIEGSGISMSPKRKRSEDHDFHGGPALKKLAQRNEKELFRLCEESLEDIRLTNNSEWIEGIHFGRDQSKEQATSSAKSSIEGHSPINPTDELIPTHRHLETRDFLQRVLSQSLANGHPERKIHTPNDLGETIEVRTRGVRGEAIDKTVSLIVDMDVPETIVAEEAVLELVLHKVIDNAIKFTDAGNISITVKLAQNSPVLEIRISDQGCGITAEAQTNLFKPFSQQDASMSRQKEGLGMGLYIAKARTRQNLGGDMILEKSSTEGPNKGSQFLIRLPISTLENEDSDMPPLIGTPSSHKHSAERTRTSTPQQTALKDALLYSAKRSSKSLSIQSAPSTPLRRSPNPRVVPRNISSGNLVHTTTSTNQNQSHIRSKSRNNTTTTTPYNPHLSKEHPLTFLVAEDNALNRKLLLKCLSSLGYSSENVLVAIDGVEAVELYKSSINQNAIPNHETKKPPRIDVVLMDLWMPNLDGYQATLRILELWREKGMELGGEEPVVMAVTADITSESQEKAKEVGMKGFMSKPYKVIDVQNLIREHFRSRRKIAP